MLFTWMPEPTFGRPDVEKSRHFNPRTSSSRSASSPAPFLSELAKSRSVPFAPL